MKILYLLSQRPDSTGSGVYLRALMAQARAAGFETEALVGVNTPEEGEGFRYQLLFGRDLPYPVVGMSDVMPYRSTRWGTLSDLAEYRRAFGSLVRQAITEFQPRLIHSNHLWHLTALAAEQRAVPVVATCHGSCLRQLALNPQLRPDLSGVKAFIALSEAQAAAIQAAYGRAPAAVAPPGFDHETFFWSAGPREGVLYAGKLSLSKGVGELLEAWDGPLTLAGGGSGPEADHLRERAGERAVGALSPSQLAGLMRQRRVFCLPSFFEGLPLVVLEALASGCRVVVNDLPGLSDWLQPEWLESGRATLVEPPALRGPDEPDPAALPAYRSRLRAALTEALEAEPLGPPQAVEAYSWKAVFSRVRTLYTDVSRA